jgi:hypothetical protein
MNGSGDISQVACPWIATNSVLMGFKSAAMVNSFWGLEMKFDENGKIVLKEVKYKKKGKEYSRLEVA